MGVVEVGSHTLKHRTTCLQVFLPTQQGVNRWLVRDKPLSVGGLQGEPVRIRERWSFGRLDM